MALVIVVLIEINERIKAKKSNDERQKTAAKPLKDADCSQEKAEHSDCSACALIEVCEKEEKKIQQRD